MPIENGFVDKKAIDDILNEGMALFVDEVIIFLTTHMPEIKPQEFFNNLLYDPDVQIPMILIAANPAMKHNTGYLVYQALKEAVDKKMKCETKNGIKND